MNNIILKQSILNNEINQYISYVNYINPNWIYYTYDENGIYLNGEEVDKNYLIDYETNTLNVYLLNLHEGIQYNPSFTSFQKIKLSINSEPIYIDGQIDDSGNVMYYSILNRNDIIYKNINKSIDKTLKKDLLLSEDECLSEYLISVDTTYPVYILKQEYTDSGSILQFELNDGYLNSYSTYRLYLPQYDDTIFDYRFPIQNNYVEIDLSQVTNSCNHLLLNNSMFTLYFYVNDSEINLDYSYKIIEKITKDINNNNIKQQFLAIQINNKEILNNLYVRIL